MRVTISATAVPVPLTESPLRLNIVTASPMANASTNLLAVEVKKTEKVSLTQVLRDYISNAYAEHPDLYTDDFRVLDELRMDCIHLGSQHNALNRLIK